MLIDTINILLYSTSYYTRKSGNTSEALVCLRTVEEMCLQEEEARQMYSMRLSAQDQANIDLLRVYINVLLSIYTFVSCTCTYFYYIIIIYY